jgi:hypothetical protein
MRLCGLTDHAADVPTGRRYLRGVDPTLCPRCDGNGEVRLYTVRGSSERVQVCDDCEACWPVGVSLRTELVQELPAGVSDDWTLLQPVDE